MLLRIIGAYLVIEACIVVVGLVALWRLWGRW